MMREVSNIQTGLISSIPRSSGYLLVSSKGLAHCLDNYFHGPFSFLSHLQVEFFLIHLPKQQIKIYLYLPLLHDYVNLKKKKNRGHYCLHLCIFESLLERVTNLMCYVIPYSRYKSQVTILCFRHYFI